MAGWIWKIGACQPPANFPPAAGRRAQPQEVAAHHVEPFDIRRRHRLDGNLVLDLLHLVFRAATARACGVIDDEIEDGVENGNPRPWPANADRLLPMLAHRGIGGRRAVPHADDMALADEEMRFAEGDAAVDQLRGARDVRASPSARL